MYSIAIRKRVNDDRFYYHDDFCFKELKINTKGQYWLADPFLFEKDGLTYLFYEAYDLIEQIGCIGYSIIHEDGTASEPKIVIRKKYHLSFPFIFEKDDQIYIMPESCGEKNIRLFKAVSFPEKWEEDNIIVSNIFACDTILIKKDCQNYLLTSHQYLNPPKEKVISCWVRNRLFKIDDTYLKLFEENGSVVAEGEEGIRNAGAVFIDEGKLIRPGQNCKEGKYGKGLKFFEIKSIEPYIENLLYEIDADEMRKHLMFDSDSFQLLGTHTYNSSDNYEVIDFSYYKDLKIKTQIARTCIKGLKKGHRGKKKIIALLHKIQKRTHRIVKKNDEDVYELMIGQNAPWVFVSYIADPFYHRGDSKYLDLHQNKREALAMGKVFNALGYNVCFMLYSSDKQIPEHNYKLLFGHEPNVQRAKEKYPKSIMVYYGVSTFYDYRNRKIKTMTESFNKTFHANVPERRLVAPHEAIENADSVLLIGSKNTILTYPEDYREKITKIHQSTQTCNYLRYVEVRGSKEFFYLAGSGNILKGIQPILEFFSKHQEYTLHWIGPVENDVKSAIKSFITPNIIPYGFQDVGSDLVLGLAERCDFLVYPSGVEGVPGSVLNAMKNGLIPLVTPWSSFDGIENYGFVMNDTNEEDIEEAINWAMSLTKEEIDRRKKACQKFVLKNYNLDRFEREFENYMRSVL